MSKYYKRKECRKQLENCAFQYFKICARENMLPSDHPVFNVALDCLKSCMKKKHSKLFRLEACFVTCYESKFGKSLSLSLSLSLSIYIYIYKLVVNFLIHSKIRLEFFMLFLVYELKLHYEFLILFYNKMLKFVSST